MQKRIRESKTATGLWDVKVGAGRLQEIELMAQAGALICGVPRATVAEGLSYAAKSGSIATEDARFLESAAKLMNRVHAATRLLSFGGWTDTRPGVAAEKVVLQATDRTSIKALEKELMQTYSTAAHVLDTALAPYEKKEGVER